MKILKYYATNKPHNLRKMTRLALLTIDSTMISRINSIIELWNYKLKKRYTTCFDKSKYIEYDTEISNF